MLTLVLLLTLFVLGWCSSDEDEKKYHAWLKTFKAAKPQHQEFCKRILMNVEQHLSSSQMGQDMFLFHNLYKYWPMNGRKGFYVDSGANHYKEHSNSE